MKHRLPFGCNLNWKKVHHWRRIVLALLLLFAIGWYLTDWHELGLVFRQTQPVYLLVSIVIYYIGVWISCVKWHMLLKVHAILLTMPSLFRWYMAGVFTGSFLPGEVSGDLVRGYFAGHGVANKAAVWTSIVVERLSGIAGMTLLAILVLVAAPSLLGWNPIIVLLLVAVVVLGCWIGLLLLLRTEVPQWVPLRIKPALLRVREALTAYLAHPDILFLCLGLSVIYHLLTVISLWFILLALMPDPPFSVAFVSPLVGMVGLLPLTPGGLGLREGVLAVLLERAGLPGGVALASSVLSRMLLWLVALTGLPVLLTEPQVFKYLQASRNSQS